MWVVVWTDGIANSSEDMTTPKTVGSVWLCLSRLILNVAERQTFSPNHNTPEHTVSHNSTMGQYFQLINVDRREAEYMGKLGEAIYYNAHLPILQLLLRQESHDDSAIGAWAGHRIITAGDYMGECPSGMLTEAEQAEVNRFAETTGCNSNGAFYYFADETFKNIPVSPLGRKLPLELKTNDLVLRNLSLHVYVWINDFQRILDEKIGNKGLDPEVEYNLNTAYIPDNSECESEWVLLVNLCMSRLLRHSGDLICCTCMFLQ